MTFKPWASLKMIMKTMTFSYFPKVIQNVGEDEDESEGSSLFYPLSFKKKKFSYCVPVCNCVG